MLCYLSLNTKAFRDHRFQAYTYRIEDENENHFDEASINQTAIDLNMPIEIRYTLYISSIYMFGNGVFQGVIA